MMYTEYKFNWHYFPAAPWAAGIPTPIYYIVFNLTLSWCDAPAALGAARS